MTSTAKTALTRRHFIVTASALFSPPISGPLGELASTRSSVDGG